VVVVHGDEENAVRLAEELNEQEGVKAFAPKLGERIDINLQ
jgi:predicted metal-dependent RNase